MALPRSGIAARFCLSSRGISVLVAAALATIPVWQTHAQTGEWLQFSGLRGPAKNRYISQQPRPASAPTGSDGHAVMLTGTIEPVLEVEIVQGTRIHNPRLAPPGVE
jgi:hypothetical protein